MRQDSIGVNQVRVRVRVWARTKIVRVHKREDRGYQGGEREECERSTSARGAQSEHGHERDASTRGSREEHQHDRSARGGGV